MCYEHILDLVLEHFCVLTELQLLCRTKMKKVMCAAGRGEGQHSTRAQCPTVSTNHTNSERVGVCKGGAPRTACKQMCRDAAHLFEATPTIMPNE